MYRLNRLCNISLALVLVTGIVLMAGHSALHDNSEVERCLMCASHADLDKVTVTQGHYVPVGISAQSIVEGLSGRLLPDGPIPAFHARAPPAPV